MEGQRLIEKEFTCLVREMVCKTPPGRWSERIRWLGDVSQDNGVSETKRCWRQGENERLMNLELFCHSSLQTGSVSDV